MSEPLIFQRWKPENPELIQLYSMNTPNGVKVSTALEEMGIPYEPHTINILNGDQFTEEFKTVSPNSKIPAILDPNGPNDDPLLMMESGAILLYLAEKSGQLFPTDPVARNRCVQWLFFQVGHIGPMFGQFGHFYKHAKDKCHDFYPTERYLNETRRLLAVLDQQLYGRPFVLGDDYSIADIAIFPWVSALTLFYEAGDILKIHEFGNVQSWLEACMQRPASVKGAKVCALE